MCKKHREEGLVDNPAPNVIKTASVKKERIAEESTKKPSAVLLEKQANPTKTSRKAEFEPQLEVPDPEITPEPVEPSKEIKEWSELKKTFYDINEESIRKSWIEYYPKLSGKELEVQVQSELKANTSIISMLENNPVQYLKEEGKRYEEWIRTATKDDIDNGMVKDWTGYLRDVNDLLNTLKSVKASL